MFPINRSLLLAFFCIGATSVQAQNEIMVLLEKPRSDVQVTKEIKVRNVTAAIVAHWLEPVKFHYSPWEETSRRAWVDAGYDESETPQLQAPVPVAFPAGVRIEKVIEDKNALQVVGNVEAVGQLEELIRQLDQPFKQVEIECQVVVVDKEALREAQFAWKPAGQTLSGALMQEARLTNFHPVLNKWVQARQAKIITAPRVVPVMGMASSVSSKSITTSAFKIYDGKQWVEFSASDSRIQSLPNLIEALALTVVPRVSADGSIQARIQMSRRFAVNFTKLKSIFKQTEKTENSLLGAISPYGPNMNSYYPLPEQSMPSHFLRHSEGIDREISIKEGETLAFTGFKPMEMLPTSLSQQQTRNLKNKEIVMFFAVREIRHLAPSRAGT